MKKQKYWQEIRGEVNFVCSTTHPLALYSDSFILNFQEVLTKFHKSEISQSGCCSVIVWQIDNLFNNIYNNITYIDSSRAVYHHAK